MECRNRSFIVRDYIMAWKRRLQTMIWCPPWFYSPDYSVSREVLLHPIAKRKLISDMEILDAKVETLTAIIWPCNPKSDRLTKRRLLSISILSADYADIIQTAPAHTKIWFTTIASDSNRLWAIFGFCLASDHPKSKCLDVPPQFRGSLMTTPENRIPSIVNHSWKYPSNYFCRPQNQNTVQHQRQNSRLAPQSCTPYSTAKSTAENVSCLIVCDIAERKKPKAKVKSTVTFAPSYHPPSAASSYDTQTNSSIVPCALNESRLDWLRVKGFIAMGKSIRYRHAPNLMNKHFLLPDWKWSVELVRSVQLRTTNHEPVITEGIVPLLILNDGFVYAFCWCGEKSNCWHIGRNVVYRQMWTRDIFNNREKSSIAIRQQLQ